jgi:hypothetical protein
MARSPSPDLALAEGEVPALLDLAEGAIAEGLAGHRPSVPPEELLPPSLRQRRGVFVTLTVEGDLNGCIGSIEGVEPLGHGVARHAWSAAFADPRFPPLQRHELGRLRIEVSVLSPLAAVPAASREELIGQLRPGVDGLLLATRNQSAVFIPAVWHQLPDPRSFVDRLQAKAGMRPGSWPHDMSAWRFTADTFVRRSGTPRAPTSAG